MAQAPVDGTLASDEMGEHKPNLAAELPPPRKLDDAALRQIREESTKLVRAIEERTASLDQLSDADLRIRLR